MWSIQFTLSIIHIGSSKTSSLAGKTFLTIKPKIEITCIRWNYTKKIAVSKCKTESFWVKCVCVRVCVCQFVCSLFTLQSTFIYLSPAFQLCAHYCFALWSTHTLPCLLACQRRRITKIESICHRMRHVKWDIVWKIIRFACFIERLSLQPHANTFQCALTKHGRILIMCVSVRVLSYIAFIVKLGTI